MLRDSVNIYMDGFLGLVPDPEQSRIFLVEEAHESEDLLELLTSWIWLHDLDFAHALKLKLWFGLTYRQLAKVFRVTPREMAQIIRVQKTALLSPYPPQHLAQETNQIEGLSCFMVEQHLGAWLDGEIGEPQMLTSMKKHLTQCEPCLSRLQEYRHLHTKILAAKPRLNPLTEEEWNETLRLQTRKRLGRWVKMSLIGVLILIIGFSFAWILWSKPEKMPNIYEIEESKINVQIFT